MHSLKSLLIASFTALAGVCMAQTNTVTPVSRYGIGIIENTASVPGRAMGGTGTALRLKNQGSFINPASYTVQDTMSFIFDVGVRSVGTEITSGENTLSKNLTNIEHITISFPVSKFLNLQLGLRPFSNVGYRIFEDVSDPDNNPQTTFLSRHVFSGTGGTNLFYLGAGIKLRKDLSVGFNTGYLFGIAKHTRETFLLSNIDTLFPKSSLNNGVESFDIRYLMYNFGIQYYPTFGKNNYCVGLLYEPSRSFNIEYNYLELQRFGTSSELIAGSSEYSLLMENTDTVVEMTIPQRLSAGFSYNYNDQYLVSLQYDIRDWSKYKFYNSTENLQSSQSYRIGFQWTPDPHTLRRGSLSSYLKRVSYRTGYSQGDLYLSYKGNQLTSKVLSAGLGLPFGNSKTTFNITYEYGNNDLGGILKERYHIFTLGLSLYDFWFYKSKFD